jgi:putative nucleotidyltransferase with HDIG domain
MRTKVPENLASYLPKPVWQIFKRFTQNGYQIYLVGGGVKNLLSNKTAVNCDFTTNATPEKIQALFPDSFYDNVFGTVGLIIKTAKGEEKYEITTYRSEWGYSDRRRPDQIKWGKKLEEDLKRRDFTFDAMVIGPNQIDDWDGKSLILIDIFNGVKDFEKKLVKAVGDPSQRFAEDALRMMRAIRFASQLGFTIEQRTFKAIVKNAQLLTKISAERIKEELFKILASLHPADGIQILRNAGLLKIILPELEKMFGVQQKSPGRHHLDDVGTHALKSLKVSDTQDPLVNLAILLHDVGKPLAAGKDKKGTITFYNHEVIGASIARNIGRRLKLSKKEQERLFTLVRWHQFSVDERQTDKAIRRFIKNVGQENILDILELRRADRLGGGAKETSWRLEKFKQKLISVQKQPFSIQDLKINGHQIMKILKITPGPLVGRILEQLFEEVVENKIVNQQEILKKRVSQIGKNLSAQPAKT